MKPSFILAVIFMHLFASPAAAQITEAKLQASGLTCAMCARSVYKNLESLPFVSDINTDLEQSSFVLTFKPGMEIDADMIKAKVEDAGFSVAGLFLSATFQHQTIETDKHILMSGRHYHLVVKNTVTIDGNKTFRLVDKSFLSPKDAKKRPEHSSSECYRTGLAAGQCCASSGIPSGQRVFHITL